MDSRSRGSSSRKPVAFKSFNREAHKSVQIDEKSSDMEQEVQ